MRTSVGQQSGLCWMEPWTRLQNLRHHCHIRDTTAAGVHGLRTHNSKAKETRAKLHGW
jgi:hypothetical protein